MRRFVLLISLMALLSLALGSSAGGPPRLVPERACARHRAESRRRSHGSHDRPRRDPERDDQRPARDHRRNPAGPQRHRDGCADDAPRNLGGEYRRHVQRSDGGVRGDRSDRARGPASSPAPLECSRSPESRICTAAASPKPSPERSASRTADRSSRHRVCAPFSQRVGHTDVPSEDVRLAGADAGVIPAFVRLLALGLRGLGAVNGQATNPAPGPYSRPNVTATTSGLRVRPSSCSSSSS